MAEFKFIFTGLGLKQISDQDPDYQFSEFAGSDPAVAISEQFGTPVLSNLVFKPGQYTDRDQIITYEGLRIDNVLMTINQQKQIIKTEVQGRRGSVKEYISEGDFVVSITGAIVSQDSEIYPADDVRRFIELMRAPVALEFTSEFLDRLGAFDMVVDSYTLPQTKGFRNVQAFTINMLSDEPVEIRVREEQKITRITSESEKTIFETIIVP